MERMPYTFEMDAVSVPQVEPAGTSAWQNGLPVLVGARVALRELRVSDAASLFAMLTTEEVRRFISPPPSTVEGFERFIQWTLRQRAAGKYICFAVTPAGEDVAIGIIQFRQLHDTFEAAEWGFAIGSPYWGTGMFQDAAKLALDFAFDTMGVHRLEARAALRNGRGTGALRKLGAVQEGVLRKSFTKDGEQLDQALWSILASDRKATKLVWSGRIH
ncbi:MAG TPA: GNAT family N-acetyltransferase [Vicinamibacterales bacterium]|nr:GNAT family N-acetyltransferase [Vicinamibacterales bacterium]